MPRPILLIVPALVFSVTAAAQPQGDSASISGTVKDGGSGEGLPNATIALYQGSDSTFATGTTTDDEGTFSLEQIQPGTYLVKVSFVGYRTERRSEVEISGTVNVGEIALTEDTEILEAAEVEAEREFIEQRADRTIYNISAQPVNTGSDVLETLRTLPSVEVDHEDRVLLRGGRNARIQVDGRSVPVSGEFLANYLKQIDSENVERVEVITNPSSEYEPDGGTGIINIVLKERSPDRGLAGGLSLGGGTRPQANVGGNISYQKGLFDTYVSYGYRLSESHNLSSQERTYIDDASSYLSLDRNSEGESGWNSHFASATIDFTPARRTTFSLRGTLGMNDSDSESLFSLTTLHRETEEATLSERENESLRSGSNLSGSLRFRQTFDEEAQHEFVIDARTSRNGNDQDQGQFRHGADLLPNTHWRRNSDRNTSTLNLRYTLPLEGNIRLNAGARASREMQLDDALFGSGGTNGMDSTSADGFDYLRTIYAGWAGATVPIVGPLETKAVLRLERAQRTFTQTSIGQENTFAYTSLFPSAFLIYNVEPGTSVRASYSRRINRPSLWSLSPLANPTDPTFRWEGNPNLRPSYTNSFELSLQYKFLVTVTPFYRRSTDVISRHLRQDGDVSVNRQENFARESSYGADVTFSGAIPGTPVKGFLSGSLYRSETDGGEVDPEIDFGSTSWSLSTNLRAEIVSGTSAQVFAWMSGPRVTEFTTSSAQIWTSIGFRQKLIGDKLTLRVNVTDPLNIQKYRFHAENGIYVETGRWSSRQRSITATLRWTFGQLSKKRQQQEDAPVDAGGGGGFGF